MGFPNTSTRGGIYTRESFALWVTLDTLTQDVLIPISTDGVTLVLKAIIRVDVSVGIGGGVEMGGGLGALEWGRVVMWVG